MALTSVLRRKDAQVRFDKTSQTRDEAQASTSIAQDSDSVSGHGLNHRATICASIPGDAHENGHALNLRATICTSTPSDAQGNGRALNHRKISALNQTTRWKNQRMGNRSAKRRNAHIVCSISISVKVQHLRVRNRTICALGRTSPVKMTQQKTCKNI